MAGGKDLRARFRAEIEGLGRRRALARALVPFHLLFLSCLCSWAALFLLGGMDPPLWPFLLPLPVGLALSFFFFQRKVRLDDPDLKDLLRSALEVEDSHPYARSLLLQARTALEERRPSLVEGAFREARRPRPWYLLYALLAFLLLLDWVGPLPWSSWAPGGERRPLGLPLAGGGKGRAPSAGSGSGREGLSPGRARVGGGQGKTSPGEGSRKEGAGRKGRAGKPPSPKPSAPRGRKGPGLSRRPSPGRVPGGAIRPRSEEKILFSLPSAGPGPKHRKKVYTTRGAPSSPPGEGRAGTRPGAPGKEGGPGRPIPGRGREGERKAPPPLARAWKRAAERALGDGLLSPGEAWLASRMAQAWRK